MSKSSHNTSRTRGRRSTRRLLSSRVPVLGLVSVLAALSFVALSGNQKTLTSYLPKRSLTIETADNVGTYNQDSIIKAAPHFPKFVPKLLVWDGNKFQVFGLKHRNTEYFETTKYTYRYVDTVPLMVNALLTNFPDRFKKDSPPFEILFSDADSPHSKCVNTKDCPVDEFSPMLLFGSVPKDQSIFPTLRAFPNPAFARCLYEYQINGKDTQCDWSQKVNKDIGWDDLQETIVWRGADWAFMPHDDRFAVDGPQKLMESMSAGKWKGKSKEEVVGELLSEPLVNGFGPRWRAGILSAQAEEQEVPWIDSRFVGGENGEIHQALARKGANITGDKMDAFAMSNYKYQIDFGGGGGTTWEGTLTKLLMPGVLLHHETANRDWFYDMIEPWKHYIPVDWDLSNLQSAFSVAQNNPDRAQSVSQEATRLAEYLLSPQYMADLHQELFVEYMGKLVSNYQPPDIAWPEMVKKYKKKGFEVYDIGVCQGKKCSIQCRAGEKSDVLFINSDAPKRDAQPALRGGQQHEQQYDGQTQQDYSSSGYDDSGNQQGGQQNEAYDQSRGYNEGNKDPYNGNAGYGDTSIQQYGQYDQSYGQQEDRSYGDQGHQGGYNQDNSWSAQQGGYDRQQGGYDQRQGGYDQRQGGYDQRQGGYDQRQGGYDQQQGGYDQRQGGYDQRQGGYDQQGGGYGQQQGGRDQQDDNSGYDQQQPRGGNDQQTGVVSESRRGRGRGRGLGSEGAGYGASTIQHDDGENVDTPSRGAPNELQQKFLSQEELAAVGTKRLSA